MAVILNAKGTSSSTFMVGKKGSLLKKNNNILEVKDNADTNVTISFDTENQTVDITRDVADSNELLTLIQDNASASGDVIAIGNDGTGDAIQIVNTNNGRGIYLDNDGSTAPAIEIVTTGTGNALQINTNKFTVNKDGDTIVDGTFTCADVVITGGSITGLSNPTVSSEVATKEYVDSIATGLNVKDSVKVATTTAQTLASDFENGDTIDGVVLSTGDRILIKDQADARENGIYVVEASGPPTRSEDADNTPGAEVSGGMFCLILQGTTNASTGWTLSSPDGLATLGTDNLVFSQFSSTGGGLVEIVQDTSPQLGGDLDINGNAIVSTSNDDIALVPNGTGLVIAGSGYDMSSGPSYAFATKDYVDNSGSLESLSDVILTTPSTNEVLTYNGSQWVNAAAAGGFPTGYNYVGTVSTAPTGTGTDTLVIGEGAAANNSDNSVIIGTGANITSTNYDNNVGIGPGVSLTGDNNVIIGNGGTMSTSGGQAIALGTSTSVSGTRGIAIGTLSNVSGQNGIAIGADSFTGTEATDIRAMAIGNEASATSDDVIAIGTNSSGSASNATAIGVLSKADNTDAIAIGTSSDAGGTDAIAIGSNSIATGANSIAIGNTADTGNSTTDNNNIAIGVNASTDGSGNTDTVAIGPNVSNTTSDTVRIGTSATNYMELNASRQLDNLVDPTSNQQAATKKYVDDNTGAANASSYFRFDPDATVIRAATNTYDGMIKGVDLDTGELIISMNSLTTVPSAGIIPTNAQSWSGIATGSSGQYIVPVNVVNVLESPNNPDLDLTTLGKVTKAIFRDDGFTCITENGYVLFGGTQANWENGTGINHTCAGPNLFVSQYGVQFDNLWSNIDYNGEHGQFCCFYYLIPTSGKLLSTGYNARGQRATGDTANYYIPTICQKTGSVDLENVIDVWGGGIEYGGTFARTSDGKFWATGYNGTGQLGLGDTTQRTLFEEVTALPTTGTVVGFVSTGRVTNQTNYFLFDNGDLYASGYNGQNQCCNGSTTALTTFTNVLSNVDAIWANGTVSPDPGGITYLQSGVYYFSGYGGIGNAFDGQDSSSNNNVEMTDIAFHGGTGLISNIIGMQSYNDTTGPYYGPNAVVSASSTYNATYNGWMPFCYSVDRNTAFSSVYAETIYWLSLNNGGSEIITVQFTDSAKTVVKYGLTNVGQSITYMPQDWTLEGSNDGSGWTTLDTQSSITWTTYEKKYFEFSNSTPYLYYRLNVSATSANTYVSIGKLYLYDTTTRPAVRNIWVGRSDAERVVYVHFDNGKLYAVGTTDNNGMLLYPGARSTTTTRVAVEAILPRGIGEIKQLYAQSTNPNLVEVVDANGELYCCWGYTNNTYEYHFNGRMTSGTGGFEGRLRNEQIKKK